jgi:hypothetical protein
MGGMKVYSVAEARALLAELRPTLDEIVTLRADAAELNLALAREPGGSPLGGLPELKAAQARLDDLVTSLRNAGVEIKGFAPLLLDFPGWLDSSPVLLCWLEGDADIAWYHRAELGFAGRRPLPEA